MSPMAMIVVHSSQSPFVMVSTCSDVGLCKTEEGNCRIMKITARAYETTSKRNLNPIANNASEAIGSSMRSDGCDAMRDIVESVRVAEQGISRNVTTQAKVRVKIKQKGSAKEISHWARE
ncbi:hypothetical protein I7I51_01138 [Histoplasma capsulatum]|uniref:Uncharacterized protein n=1 Tax=Ajellomyces capsulatus TaxID=5037 RepID=A0A8A1MC55_AJECA|nr:hypothetical protein I7I51_01138 [Histoplasma capsulatum]